ncbi:MAG: hypothetical protein J6T64_04900, partial [Bacteroidaceae bacterium]|nr:hypothetical protein [Bacteroidaceae bacterium]
MIYQFFRLWSKGNKKKAILHLPSQKNSSARPQHSLKSPMRTSRQSRHFREGKKNYEEGKKIFGEGKNFFGEQISQDGEGKNPYSLSILTQRGSVGTE